LPTTVALTHGSGKPSVDLTSEVGRFMTEVDPQADSAGASRRVRLDLWLNVVLAVLVLLVLSGGAWFAYSVYTAKQQEYASSAAGRVATALAAQVRKSPNDPVLRVRLGEALGAAGKYPEAVAQLNAALKINPKHSGALFDLGTLAEMNNKAEEAKAYYQKVIDVTEASQYSKLDPLREQAFFNLGAINLKQKQYSQAAGFFKASLGLRKDASDTYFQLAMALDGMGDTDAAISNLGIALQFDPNYADAHYLLGTLYQKQKNIADASAEYSAAASSSPDTVLFKKALSSLGTSQSWLSKAQAAFSAGTLSEALDDARVATNLDPTNFAAIKLGGDILLQQGELTKALDAYKHADQVKPGDPYIKGKIAELTPKVKAAAKKSKSKKK
jgi:tetratricopeptide (TPR) repeat protein